jgi:hypothetical protein
MTPMGGGWWQNLAEATVNGRPVLIKRYEGREGRKVRILFTVGSRGCSLRTLPLAETGRPGILEKCLVRPIGLGL